MARKARFTVSLNKARAEAAQVSWATVAGTATPPDDYTVGSGTLTFAPGVTTMTVDVDVRATDQETEERFTAVLAPAAGISLGRASGVCVLPGVAAPETGWAARFTWIYNKLKDTANGYFGPPSGPKAFAVPYHARERAIIIEAPDWSHESVSETQSYWIKLEAWKSILSGDTSGLLDAWQAIDNHWIPDATNGQPWGTYTPSAPSSYVPAPQALEDTPVDYSTAVTVGADPLYAPLLAAYGTAQCYGMHWQIDADGDFGFHNPDMTMTVTFINGYQRGSVEDGLAIIIHPCYDDFKNGGGPYGFQPIYGRSPELYTGSTGYPYSKQWNYSVAADADVRAVSSLFIAHQEMTGTFPSTLLAKGKKMADFLRYTGYDKHFVAHAYDASGCHFLIGWGWGYGGGIPENGQPSGWSFRLGNSSETHHGYNGIDVAYACATGQPFAPLAAGSPAWWAISLTRQIEFIRWLQSPEGPIAGGVTSSWRGRYETPTDARLTARFYGQYYVSSPSWYNPPSNNWTGFQAWGLERLASVYRLASAKSDEFNVRIAYRIGVILDKFMPWLFNNCTYDAEELIISYPINTRWTSDAIIPGVTSDEPAQRFVGLSVNPPVTTEDTYEYLPTLDWDSNGDYELFWNGDGSVPNPNLHCVITEMGWDPGTAAGFAQIIIQYVQAKKQIFGTLTGTIPNTTITYQSLLDLAVAIMDIIWRTRDDVGFGSVQDLGAYKRIDDKLWIPPEFGNHAMPNGEVLANNVTTFASMRASLYESTPEWTQLRAYLDDQKLETPTGIIAPTVNFHRFWNQADVAGGFAMLEKFFPETCPVAEAA